MKPLRFAIILLVCGTPLFAQRQAPSGGITIGMRPNGPVYCKGAFRGVGLTDPDDITLRVPLKVWYENQLSQKVVLSGSSNWVITATVAGQNTPVHSRRGGGGETLPTITLEPKPNGGPALLQCLTEKDAGCSNAYMYVPVLDRSKGLYLRGETVELVMTRDHSLAPDMVAKLQEKVKDSGTVFSGMVGSRGVTLWIPKEPLTRNCPFG